MSKLSVQAAAWHQSKASGTLAVCALTSTTVRPVKLIKPMNMLSLRSADPNKHHHLFSVTTRMPRLVIANTDKKCSNAMPTDRVKLKNLTMEVTNTSNYSTMLKKNTDSNKKRISSKC